LLSSNTRRPSEPRLFAIDRKNCRRGWGTSGIGRAISLGLAESGADVVASARRQEQVDATAAEIEARGRKTLRLTCDMQDRSSLQRLLNESVAHFGKVDILVNSAGKIKRAPTLTFPETMEGHH